MPWILVLIDPTRTTRVRRPEDPNPDVKTQGKEGHCFTCNHQGHIANKCPDKDKKGKAKPKVKACAAEMEEEDDEASDTESFITKLLDNMKQWVKIGRAMSNEHKAVTMQHMMNEVNKEDFYQE